MPLQDLPQDVKHILEKFAAQLDVHVVSQFIQNILDAVLETVPDGGSKQAIPKAKVSQSGPSEASLVMLLSWHTFHVSHILSYATCML